MNKKIKGDSYTIDDDIIADKDIYIRNNMDFLCELKRIFEIEERIKQDELQRSGVTCICGKCAIPIWFTYNEIINTLDETLQKLKERKI